MFMSKFRLEKHKQMHLNVAIKTCHYFKRNKPCPYEILGCKFRHEEEKEDNTNKHLDEHVPDSNELDETNITEEDTIEVGHTAGHTSDIFDKVKELEELYTSSEEISSIQVLRTSPRQNVPGFHASTPKKSYPCEECEVGSECVDCFVLHILGKHEIARLEFS